MCNDNWPVKNIIWVDTKEFLKVWANEPFCHQGPDEWRKDHKFHMAEECFLQSAEYPVPVAFLGIGRFCADHDGYLVKFIDGITRTIWLMSNGAESFPVYTSDKSLKPMKKLIGQKSAFRPRPWKYIISIFK